MQPTTVRNCVRCQQPLGDALFCQYCGTFVLDPEGTVVMASRGERILAWLVNIVLLFLTLFIGWIIWWFIVAPKGQNPGKAVVGLRVIRGNGNAVTTGGDVRAWPGRRRLRADLVGEPRGRLLDVLRQE